MVEENQVNTEGNVEETNESVDTQETETFTQDDVNKAVEARLARERKEFQKKLDEKAEEVAEKKLKEKQRIAQLSEEEQRNEELSERERRIEEKIKELEHRERYSDTEQTLRDRELPSSFAKFLITNDEESTFENIKEFQNEWEVAKKEELKKALSGKPPKVNINQQQAKNPFAKETFNLTEQGRLLKENPELYKQFKAQANK